GGIFYALIPDHEMPGHNQLESTELYIGRNVDVLYNPENPSAVVSKKEIVFVLLIYLATMSLGALMFLIGKRPSK
ncbi:MAG: hypothetical protein IT286_01230, partial [Proteobacteria bacterium]|nr:hypothetical protein [Pseudomonadota bacterium]